MVASLTSEELTFFKRFGYLIKSAALAPEVCEQLLERMWESAPASLSRQDPETYGILPEHEWSADPLRTISKDKWQYRALGTEPLLIDIMTRSALFVWAEQLLGQGKVRRPTLGGKPMGHSGPAWPGGPVDPQITDGARGIYATLPNPELASAEDGLHTDGHPFHFGVVCLLEDCPPEAGAFKVWPGSHRRFQPLFPMPYDQARVPFYEHLPSHKGLVHPDAYLAEVKRVETDTPPVDAFGKQGDIILWHHRLGHMAGHHKAQSRTIRQALLFDYNHIDLDRQRCQRTPQDMWTDWSAELREANAALTPDFLISQRLPQALYET